MKKRGLGRSLNAILSPIAAQKNTPEAAITNTDNTAIHSLPIAQLTPGKYQPRREMDDNALNELATSIRAQGILQPILVRKTAKENYEIIAGERRWRAAHKAELTAVPVIIKEIPDEAAMAIGLIENIQRENLNAMDEAFGLQRLLTEFSLTHQEIAEAIGRSRTAVSNLLRLLNLPEAVQKYLQHGDLEMGHARALLALPKIQQVRAAEHLVEKNLSVRETERYIKQLQTLSDVRTHVKSSTHSTEITQWQKQLSAKLGTKVAIQQGATGKGKIIISYISSTELQKLLQQLQT